jgi:hypothetical protein
MENGLDPNFCYEHYSRITTEYLHTEVNLA